MVGECLRWVVGWQRGGAALRGGTQGRHSGAAGGCELVFVVLIMCSFGRAGMFAMPRLA